MTVTAKDRGWGDPSVDGYPYRMTTIEVDNTSYRVQKAVAAIFKDFLTRLCRENNYSLDEVKDDWSYILRPVRGYEDEYRATGDVRYLSNHSWGLAVDVNATKNPMADRLITDMPVAWIRANAPKYMIRWGGDYDGRKDAMHFEFIGTPEDAKRITYNLASENIMARLDQEDRDDIRTIVRQEVTKIYHLLQGNAGSVDADPTHASINDVIRLGKDQHEG